MVSEETNVIHLETQPSEPSSSMFWLMIILIVITIVLLMVYFMRKPKKEPKGKTEETTHLGTSLDKFSLVTMYESAKAAIDHWMGKTLLYMNMRGDAIVYNYPFEKGFLEKIFDNVKLPR